MAIKAQAHVVAISPYDLTHVRVEVRMVAERSGEADMATELFVIPISAGANDDIGDAVKAYLSTNWSVSFGLLDTVQLFGATSLI